MRWRGRKASRPLLLLITAAFVGSVACLLHAEGKTSSGLIVTLEPYERRFLRDEPFAVRVTLANEGSRRIHLDPSFSIMSSGYLSFDIIDQTGRKIGYYADQGVDDTFHPPNYKGMELKPGDRYTA